MATEKPDARLVRNAGLALIVGGLFVILRVVPMRLSDGVTSDNFPPSTVEDIVLFAQLPVWEALHALGIVAVILLIFGVTVLSRLAQAYGQTGPGMMAQTSITVSLLLFAVALVSDGLVLPTIIQKLAHVGQNGVSENAVLVEYVHLFATSLGGYSAAALLFSAIFLGVTLNRAFGAKKLGAFGVIIGITSMLGYATGLIGLDLSASFMIVGPLTMFMFLYLVVIGAMLLQESKSEAGRAVS